MLPNHTPPYTSDTTDISESSSSSGLFFNNQQINSSSVDLVAPDSSVSPQINQSCQSPLVEAISSHTTDKAKSISNQLSANSSHESLSLSLEETEIIPSSELVQEVSENVDTYQPTDQLPDDKNLFSDSNHQSENLLLHKQIETLTCKLLASQDQIGRLLEEKRIWVENMQHSINSKESNHQVTPGELRGRWLQAKNLAETYKRDKESMVIKYAQDLALAREKIESLSKKQSSDASLISTLTSKLSQVQESLKSEQKKSSSLSENLNRVNRSLECAQKQAKEAERLREREAERLCSEVALQEAQASLKQCRNENDTLKQQLKEFETVKDNLEKSQSRIDILTSELSSANDMKLELQSCKRRIDQLSDFTRRLTERHANLQAEHLVTLSSLEETKNLLIEKGEEIVQLNEKHENERKESEEKMATIRCEFNDLSVKLNKLNESENWLKIQLKEEKERATAIHKRDIARIKDITREVTRLSHQKSQTNQSDCYCLTNNSPSDLENELNSKSSTNSSNGSLKSLNLNQITTERENEKNVNPLSTVSMKQSILTNGFDSLSSPIDNHNKIDDYESTIDDISFNLKCSERNVLLEKIDRLQRNQVKLTDKIEFFQEHCYQLTEELNKKSKIIQNLLVSLDKHHESTNSYINEHNHNNKKILNINQKYNSILSSLSGSGSSSGGGIKTKKTNDTGLCVDGNCQKLQNLLEDTIFKNVTLKENLNKLGLEISSLRLTHERLLNSLCHSCKLTIENLLKTPQHSNNSNNHSITQIKSEPPIFQNGGVSA
ncbi:unnamed protein product [Schistosoma turkestanicum]|nr:unnamed protein product [Schistosoma turkestanicum]